MASRVAWLDHDGEGRRRMHDAIQMFREEGAVDELGIGRIRDAFSDRLFPGTSVLWRRARYLLFVPWIYLLLERGGGGRGSAEDRARKLQRRLALTLRESAGAGSGVIGASGADVKQPPDVILWAALATWGIRRDGGSLGQVREMVAARRRRDGDPEEELDLLDGVWDPRVAALRPADFPAAASFELTDAEAALLRDLATGGDALPGTPAAQRRDSLLAVLVREGVPDNVEAPWSHPMSTASRDLREAVRHAGLFSDLLDGARLLYAELVSRQQRDADLAAAVDQAFAGWAPLSDAGRREEIRLWIAEMDDFWRVVRGINSRISPAEERFVREWAALVREDPAAVRQSDRAAQLIVDREHSAKDAHRARLSRDGTFGRDAQAVLPAKLTFRWEQARQIVADIRQEA
ncbi:MAG TPA: DUF6361 family protein [Solirubrobacterales bacterium]